MDFIVFVRLLIAVTPCCRDVRILVKPPPSPDLDILLLPLVIFAYPTKSTYVSCAAADGVPVVVTA